MHANEPNLDVTLDSASLFVGLGATAPDGRSLRPGVRENEPKLDGSLGAASRWPTFEVRANEPKLDQVADFFRITTRFRTIMKKTNRSVAAVVRLPERQPLLFGTIEKTGRRVRRWAAVFERDRLQSERDADDNWVMWLPGSSPRPAGRTRERVRDGDNRRVPLP